MSERLIGNCGYIVGESRYFRKINESSKLSDVLKIPQDYQYCNGLKNMCRNISFIISDVYTDIRKNAKILNFIESGNREETISIIHGLNEVCKMWDISCSDAERAISFLSLSSYETRLKSSAGITNILKAAQKVKNGNYTSVSSYEKVRLIEKASNIGLLKAAGGDVNKLGYLADIEQGKGTVFLEDVLTGYEFCYNSRRCTGRNGKELCSRDYNRAIVDAAFNGDSLGSNMGSSPKKYAETIKSRLNQIYHEIEHDIKTGIRENDYIEDYEGKNLKEALEELSKAGESCYDLKSKVNSLMWFVGGNLGEIKQLQRNLNSLGIRGSDGSLKEDGVYGKATRTAWNIFFTTLVKGPAPVLAWTDFLQSEYTHINLEFKETASGKFLRLGADGESQKLLRLDKHSYRGKDGIYVKDYYHFNIDTLPDASPRQIKLAKKLDHIEISEEAYNLLKNFDNTAKVVRIAGRTLLVVGIVADTISLGQAINEDLNDADKKIGKRTYTEVARIGGGWAGAIAGAKAGAVIGGMAGSSALPGAGTVIGAAGGALILGIIGGLGGSALAEYIVDISCLE